MHNMDKPHLPPTSSSMDSSSVDPFSMESMDSSTVDPVTSETISLPANSKKVREEGKAYKSVVTCKGLKLRMMTVVLFPPPPKVAYKRRPTTLSLACGVCGAPAPDHVHFGGSKLRYYVQYSLIE